MTRKLVFALISLSAALSVADTSTALTITYEATDLADVSIGEDRWLYTYSLSDGTFEADQGFVILFDVTTTGSIDEASILSGSDWDVIALQPDPAIPDDGIFDALALTDSPSLASPFSVEFVWLGPGTPGSQIFEVYDTDFSILELGTTIRSGPATPPIPEPSATLLYLSGLLIVGTMRPARLVSGSAWQPQD